MGAGLRDAPAPAGRSGVLAPPVAACTRRMAANGMARIEKPGSIFSGDAEMM